jgi:hypothetical protein
MPMNFPDMKSLISAAEVHEFRQPKENETQAAYRNALADHVAPRDFIESQEIRNGTGWDKWDDFQKTDLVLRGILGKKGYNAQKQ